MYLGVNYVALCQALGVQVVNDFRPLSQLSIKHCESPILTS